MSQLVERRACNHPADLAGRTVGAKAACLAGEPQADAAAGALDGAGQRAVIDDLRADGAQAAAARQCLRPHQHAAAGRAGRRRIRARNPGRRIQFQEEKDKRRNQPAFGVVADGELNHRGQQIGIQPPRVGHQPRHIIRFVMDIGVGEQQVVRLKRLGRRHTARHGADLAAPARIRPRATQQREAFRRAELRSGGAHHLGGTVAARIIHDDEVQLTRKLLREQ